MEIKHVDEQNEGKLKWKWTQKKVKWERKKHYSRANKLKKDIQKKWYGLMLFKSLDSASGDMLGTCAASSLCSVIKI